MASNEQINVEIRSDYDDKDAKKALEDAKKLDATEATVEVNVDDNASGDLARIDTKLDGVDGRNVEATVDVDDNASTVVAGVDTTLDGIDGRNAEATLDVDDNASRDIDAVDSDLDAIDGRTVSATVDTDVGAGLADVEADLTAIDGGTYKATVDAGTGTGLTDIEGDLKAIDGGTYKATVDASTGTGLTDIEGDLKAIDGGTYKATVDAAATAGAAGLIAGIGGLPARIGEMGPKLTSLASAGGPIAAVAAAFIGAATQAAEVATTADTIADLTGTSTENASALAAVLRDNTNIEAGDLLDIIAQVTGALQQNPKLLDQLGISADTVRQGPFATFIAAVDAWNSGQLSANDKMIIGSQLFGEEGLRQIGMLTSALDTDLQTAIDGVAETRIMSDDDVQAARDFKAGMIDVKAEFDALVLQLGTDFLPLLAQAADIAGLIARNLIRDDSGTFFGGISTKEEMLEKWGHAQEDVNDQITTGQQGLEWLADSWGVSLDAMETATEALPPAKSALESYVDAVEVSIGMLEDQTAALEDAAAASDAQTEAMLGANDAFYGNRDAVRDARDAVDKYNEVADDSESTADDQAEALDRVAQAADDVAQSEVDVATQTAEAAGQTLSHVGALDIENESLIEQASQLQGPTRQAILDHIGRLNDIPPEVVSQILALLDEGKIDEAEELLNETSRTREAALVADNDDAALWTAEQELEDLAKDREAKIIVNAYKGFVASGIPDIFGGGRSVESTPAPGVPVVTPQTVVGGDTYNLNLPRGTRIGDTIRELDRHARRNGRRAYAFRR